MNKNTPDTKLKLFFEQAYGKKLTNKEVLEYKDRLINFFSLLIEIDQRNTRKSNEDQNNGNTNNSY